MVDTNIVAYLCLQGEQAAAAERLRLADPDWYAPQLWGSEFRNVLAGQMRRGVMDLAAACAAWEKAERTVLTRFVDSQRVLLLIAATRCSAYDLEFAALAQQLGVELVTMDRELLHNFPGLARPLA